MVTRVGIVICLALLAPPAHAREWTDEEVRLGAALAVTRIIDWGQTRHIARNPDRFRETVPLMPAHPTLGEVNQHFLLGTALMFAVAHYVPQHRKRILQVWVAIGVGANLHNAAIGVRIEF